MSEEEKEAMEDTKDILKELDKHKDKDFIGRLYYKNKPIEDILQILLNLIENQQKGNKNWEEIYDEDQNYIGELNDKILDLEFKIKRQQKEIEGTLITAYLNGADDGEKKVEAKIEARIEKLDEEIEVKREIAKNPTDKVSGRLLTDEIVELEKTKKVLQSLLEKGNENE